MNPISHAEPTPREVREDEVTDVTPLTVLHRSFDEDHSAGKYRDKLCAAQCLHYLLHTVLVGVLVWSTCVVYYAELVLTVNLGVFQLPWRLMYVPAVVLFTLVLTASLLGFVLLGFKRTRWWYRVFCLATVVAMLLVALLNTALLAVDMDRGLEEAWRRAVAHNSSGMCTVMAGFHCSGWKRGPCEPTGDDSTSELPEWCPTCDPNERFPIPDGHDMCATVISDEFRSLHGKVYYSALVVGAFALIIFAIMKALERLCGAAYEELPDS